MFSSVICFLLVKLFICTVYESIFCSYCTYYNIFPAIFHVNIYINFIFLQIQS